MVYKYDIKTSKKDTCSTVCLSVCHLMFSAINIFLSTFLIAHIYSLTNDLYSYVLNVGFFQLSTYVCMFIAYYLISFLVDKTNRIWIYRIGNFIVAGLVVVTIFYGKDLAKIVFLAGLLNGLAHAVYYASYNVLKQEMVSRKSMNKFVFAIMILHKLVSVVCPILLGALIEVSTFSMVAIYVLVLSVIQTIISFFIKAKKPEESNFNVKKYLKKLKEDPKKYKKVISIYLICIPYGLATITTALLNVNIMMFLGSNFSLGLLTSVFAILSCVVLILLNKFSKAGKRAWIYICIALMQIVGTLIFAIMPNMVTLILFNIGLAVCDAIIVTVVDLYRNKNLKECGLYDDIAEHQCVVESIFQIVRILSFSLLIVLGLIKNYILFQIFFVIFMVLYASTAFLLIRYEKSSSTD